MATKRKADATTPSADCPETLAKHPFYGLDLDEDQRAFRDAIWDKDVKIVFCNAKSGSGKTLVAVATANLLCEYGRYSGITHVVNPVSEQKIGFLPGTIENKIEPYAQPLFDALYKLGISANNVVNQQDVISQKNGAYIDCISHLYLRGCNLENRVVIADEFQNLYFDEAKKVLTRISDSCKAIIIGHTGQCDLIKNPEKSGFSRYIEHFRTQPWCRVCELHTNHRGDVARWADEL